MWIFGFGAGFCEIPVNERIRHVRLDVWYSCQSVDKVAEAHTGMIILLLQLPSLIEYCYYVNMTCLCMM